MRLLLLILLLTSCASAPQMKGKWKCVEKNMLFVHEDDDVPSFCSKWERME